MDLECRKDRTSDLLASSSQAWLNPKHFIFRATEDFLNALASLWVREAPLLIVLIRAAAHRGHWSLENSFSISGSRRAGCLQGLSLIKLLGSNYNAVTSLAEISALHVLEGTQCCSPETLESKLCSVSASSSSLKLSNYWICGEDKPSLFWICAGKTGWWLYELPWLVYQNISKMIVISVTEMMTFSFSPSPLSALCENVQTKMLFLNTAKW